MGGIQSMREEWRDITGYEGLYQVSNLGRVKSLDRYLPFSGTISLRKGCLLKQSINKYGYERLGLYKNGKYKQHTVHRLVANTFIPNPDNLPCVNHKDENKLNNCVDNLEFCTVAYNNNYGTVKQRISEKNKISMKGKYNRPDLVRPVLQYTLDGQFVAEYQSMAEAERQTGIHQTSISGCCRGIKYNHTAGGYVWKYKNINNLTNVEK